MDAILKWELAFSSKIEAVTKKVCQEFGLTRDGLSLLAVLAAFCIVSIDHQILLIAINASVALHLALVAGQLILLITARSPFWIFPSKDNRGGYR